MNEIAVAVGSIDDARPLLDEAGLSVDDLGAHLGEILIARADGASVGCIAIERYGDQALLRSLAVTRVRRGSGIGAALVVAALNSAKAKGASEVFSVTVGAAAYLSKFGFERVGRSAVVGAIASSAQLCGACPDDAVVLRRKLRPVVLFMCVHNAGRSQMAAALLARRTAGRVEVRSAGSEPESSIHPAVVETMREIGIDLVTETPKRITLDMVEQADIVVTMGCGESCPIVPGKRYLDWDLADPAERTETEVRAIRNAIELRVDELIRELGICLRD